MNIKILGSGCPSCKKLEANASKAVAQLGVDATIEKVTDIEKIMEYGVMSTPALVVDEEVKLYGKVGTVKDIVELLN